MSLSSDDAQEMLEEIEKHDDARVLRVLEIAWDDENDDAFLWSVNGCSECCEPLARGATGYLWGAPLNTDKDCKYVTLKTLCSESCTEAAVHAWSTNLPVGTEVITVYHG